MYYLPTSLIESDVALAYLPSATVTITAADMIIIMFLVIVHENKKLIFKALNFVNKGKFNGNFEA